MIDEKKIVHAASDYADKRCEEDEELSFNQLLDAFEDGANWLLDNLWHNANEYPELDKSILLDLASNDYVVVKLRNKYEFSQYPYTKVSRWLYIEDLTKGGK